MRAVLLLVVAAACATERKPTVSDPPETPRPMPVIPAPDPPPDAPSIDAPTAPTCLPTTEVQSVFARGDEVIACFGPAADDLDTCWTIANDNTARGLLDIVTPAPQARSIEGPPALELIAPEGWTATPIGEGSPVQRVKAIEVCDPAKTCTRLALKKSTKEDLDEVVSTIAIAPDGKTVVIDRGSPQMSASQLELHSLATKKLVRTLKVPKWDCANFVDFVDDQILAIGFDCANHGGSYGVFSTKGKLTADIWSSADQSFSFGDPYGSLGKGRWVFGDTYGLAVWDLRKGKRLAKLDLTARDKRPRIATQGEHVVEVFGDGTITRYDAKLAVVSTAKLPACP